MAEGVTSVFGGHTRVGREGLAGCADQSKVTFQTTLTRKGFGTSPITHGNHVGARNPDCDNITFGEIGPVSLGAKVPVSLKSPAKHLTRHRGYCF
jgi:hypothetical protein